MDKLALYGYYFLGLEYLEYKRTANHLLPTGLPWRLCFYVILVLFARTNLWPVDDYRQGLLPNLRPSSTVPVNCQEPQIQVGSAPKRRYFSVTKPAGCTTPYCAFSPWQSVPMDQKP
jgi:hypothetical protein